MCNTPHPSTQRTNSSIRLRNSRTLSSSYCANGRFMLAVTNLRWIKHASISSTALRFFNELPGDTSWPNPSNKTRAKVSGKQAQAAAVEYAQVLTSIDSTKVDENFDRVLDGATGEFKDMYSESSVELRQLLIDNEAAAHGVVVESAVQSASTDEVVVLLFVDQSVSNSSIPDPRIDRSRIKMTMEFVDGRWRASKVELP